MKTPPTPLAAPSKTAAKRTPPRMLEVTRVEQPHPEIKRVIFSGTDLEGFPHDMNGAHIKLFFPKPHQREPMLPTLGANAPVWPSGNDRPITRTYSVRYYDKARNELAVDFVWHSLHEPYHRNETARRQINTRQGPAQTWLSHVAVGQKLGVAGPGGPDPLIFPAKHQYLIGDTSALAAIWALTERASNSHRHVFIVSNHDADFYQPLNTIRFFRPDDYSTLAELYQDLLFELEQHLKHTGLTPSSDLSAFVAGENSLVLSLREYLKREYKLTKKRLYAIPYWRLGQDEEAYHQARHNIMDEVY